jgi:hypothetical protein
MLGQRDPVPIAKANGVDVYGCVLDKRTPICTKGNQGVGKHFVLKLLSILKRTDSRAPHRHAPSSEKKCKAPQV